MLLNYLDESYDERVYWICALACRDAAAIPLTEGLDAVVAKAADSHGIAPDAELHGHALFHGKGEWSPLAVRPRARIGIYNDAFAAIAEHAAGICTRGVDRGRLLDRYVRPFHPHTVVLQHLLERIDIQAEREGEYALVIADEIEGAHEYRADLWRYQRNATPGFRSRRLTRVVDTIHFAPSSSSRLLQAADLVAFLHRRISADVEREPRAVRANAALWERVAHLTHESGCWYP